MAILATGVAGFNGMHRARRLPEQGSNIIGIDRLSSYDDASLKKEPLPVFRTYTHFCFLRLDLAADDSLDVKCTLADQTESIHRMVQALP